MCVCVCTLLRYPLDLNPPFEWWGVYSELQLNAAAAHADKRMAMCVHTRTYTHTCICVYRTGPSHTVQSLVYTLMRATFNSFR